MKDQVQGGPASATVPGDSQEIADLRAANAALEARLAKLESAAEPGDAGRIAFMPGVHEKTVYERQIERLRDRRAQMAAMLAQSDAALEDGPQKFRLSIEGEPRMVRVVGAGSEHEARAKYIAYFGIVSTGNKAVDVKVIDAVAAPHGSGSLSSGASVPPPPVTASDFGEPSDRVVRIRHMSKPDDGFKKKIGSLQANQSILSVPRPNCPDCGQVLPPLGDGSVDPIDSSQACTGCGSFFKTISVPRHSYLARTIFVIRGS